MGNKSRENLRVVLLALGLSACAPGVKVEGAAGLVTVSAGSFNRRDTPVEVTFDRSPGGGPWQLSDDSGTAIPLQIRDDRHGQFILPKLKANETRTFRIEAAHQPIGGVEVKREAGTLRVSIGGREAFVYQGAKTPLPAGYPPQFQRGGYIFPVLTPSGRNIADDYPANHKHHHGIWSPWTKTEFEGRHPDFWNMGDKTGTVEVVDYRGEFSGPVCGGFVAHHRFVDLIAVPPKDVLNETWQVVAYRIGDRSAHPYFMFDMTITQTCATDSPLTLEKYRYGGLAFRGAPSWEGKDGCQFLTSEGKTRANGNESRGRWCRISGEVGGRPASIAIFDRPDDFRFPQPMRVFPDQPYFCYAPEQLGEFQILPGKPFVEHYRFIVSDDVIDAGELDGMWNDYAHPPSAVLKQPNQMPGVRH